MRNSHSERICWNSHFPHFFFFFLFLADLSNNVINLIKHHDLEPNSFTSRNYHAARGNQRNQDASSIKDLPSEDEDKSTSCAMFFPSSRAYRHIQRVLFTLQLTFELLCEYGPPATRLRTIFQFSGNQLLPLLAPNRTVHRRWFEWFLILFFLFCFNGLWCRVIFKNREWRRKYEFAERLRLTKLFKILMSWWTHCFERRYVRWRDNGIENLWLCVFFLF